jgi:hypothetical protein
MNVAVFEPALPRKQQPHMASTLKIGNTEVGTGQPAYIVGEIVINQNLRISTLVNRNQ